MSTIEVIALKPFVYSEDGYTEIPVFERQTFNLPERFFQGLNDARYVRRATIGDGKVSLRVDIAKSMSDSTVKMVDDAVKPVLESSKEPIPETAYLPTAEPRAQQAAVEIPENYADMKWFALRSLASQVSDTPVNNKEEAIAAIEAELARRAGA